LSEIAPDFRPHRLLRSGHAQTIFAAFWGGVKIPYNASNHIIDTTHGDRLVLHDDCPATTWRSGDVCVLLVHGLGGCHGSPYMVRIAHKLNARGLRTFRMDQRGCGAGYHIATKPGHAGRSEDVEAAVSFVARQCPQSPLVLVGFSLGANLVLKLLGEWGSAPPTCVSRAMAVAPPIDLLVCSRNMEQGRMRMYNRWFVRSLIQQTHARRELVPELAQLIQPNPPRTLFEFDDRVTAPLSGFTGATDYYTRSSSIGKLIDVSIPTLILAAADDPIIPVQMFEKLSCSSAMALHITQHGGHVGFIGHNGPDPDRFWLDWRVVDFVTRE
jgi:predicted alpha/beta-fold hydrolase